jgi:hypothetical protein
MTTAGWAIAGATIGLGTMFLAKTAFRALARAIIRSAIANRARVQPTNFVTLLREAVFRQPFAIVEILWSDGRDAFVRKMWADAARGPARRPMDQPEVAAGADITVYRTHLPDGRAIAVISLPTPQRNSEPFLAAAVLPCDERLRNDVARARRVAHVFVLNRGSTEYGRETDLCSWNAAGRLFTYNVGAPRDPAGFAQAVGAKLFELKK